MVQLAAQPWEFRPLRGVDDTLGLHPRPKGAESNLEELHRHGVAALKPVPA